MKKVCIFLVVCFATFSMQAAQVFWGTSDPTSFLVIGSDGVSAAPVGWATALIYVGSDGVVGGVDDVVAQTGTVGGSKSKIGAVQGAFTYAFNSPYTTGDKFVLAVYDNAVQSSAANVLYVYKSGTTPYSIQTTDGLTADYFQFGVNVGGTAIDGLPGQWVPVPEPTSMALFGLGAGILALRRRFQKKA